jgi:hypothetical protein
LGYKKDIIHIMEKVTGNRYIHGYSMGEGKRFYRVWSNMKSRCNNPKATYFRNYGGRGISVCARWGNFKNFMEDMHDSYKDGLTLDRVDNNGNYESTNCRWVSMKVQNNNSRNVRKLNFRGMNRTISEWAKELNITVRAIQKRLYVYDWEVDRILSTPMRKVGVNG